MIINKSREGRKRMKERRARDRFYLWVLGGRLQESSSTNENINNSKAKSLFLIEEQNSYALSFAVNTGYDRKSRI